MECGKKIPYPRSEDADSIHFIYIWLYKKTRKKFLARPQDPNVGGGENKLLLLTSLRAEGSY